MARLHRWVAGPAPVILMYHRVTSLAADPWGLSVQPANFAGHIALLRQHREVVPLSWLVSRIDEGAPVGRLAAVTFDDGYIDVLREAKPILERLDCPATVFIPTDFVGDPRGFWWDTLSRVFLETAILPEVIEVTVNGAAMSFPIRDRSHDGGSSRQSAHQEIWRRLRELSSAPRHDIIEQIVDWSGTATSAPEADRCVSEAQLRELASSGVMAIGAHTMSHPSLVGLSMDAQYREIAGSANVLKEMLGASPAGLAYPYGDHNNGSVRAAGQAGLSYACTTETRTVSRGGDLLTLPRVNVTDLSGPRFVQEVLGVV